MGGTNKQIDIAGNLESAKNFCDTLNEQQDVLNKFCFLVDWLKDADGTHKEAPRLTLATRLLTNDEVKSETVVVQHGGDTQNMTIDTFVKVYTGQETVKTGETDLLTSETFEAFNYLRSFTLNLCRKTKDALPGLTSEAVENIGILRRGLKDRLTEYVSLTKKGKQKTTKGAPDLKRVAKVSEYELRLRRGPVNSSGTVVSAGQSITKLDGWAKLNTSFKYALLNVPAQEMRQFHTEISALGTDVWIETEAGNKWLNLKDPNVTLDKLKKTTIGEVIYYVLARPVKKMSKDQHRQLLFKIRSCHGDLRSPA